MEAVRQIFSRNRLPFTLISLLALLLAAPLFVVITAPLHSNAPEWAHVSSTILPAHLWETIRLCSGVLLIALLIAVQGAYLAFGRGIEFFPSVEPENVSLWVHGRGNLSIHERDALVREVEQEVLHLQAERGEFHSIYARSLASSGRENDEEPEDLVGIIQLEFVDWFARRRGVPGGAGRAVGAGAREQPGAERQAGERSGEAGHQAFSTLRYSATEFRSGLMSKVKGMVQVTPCSQRATRAAFSREYHRRLPRM